MDTTQDDSDLLHRFLPAQQSEAAEAFDDEFLREVRDRLTAVFPDKVQLSRKRLMEDPDSEEVYSRAEGASSVEDLLADIMTPLMNEIEEQVRAHGFEPSATNWSIRYEHFTAGIDRDGSVSSRGLHGSVRVLVVDKPVEAD